MKPILVYHDGGQTCLHDVTATRAAIKKEANVAGQIGYLSGYRYFNNDSQSVMVFFTERPTQIEIERRRSNGLRAAQWHYIN